MSAKRHRPAIDVFDDDEESMTCGDTAPTQIIQRHTHLESSTHGISSVQSYYSMPASPQKKSRSTQPDPIHWNDEMPDLINVEDDVEDDEDELRSRLMDPDLRDNTDEESKRTRKNPLHVWIPEIDTFVQEFLRLEGRGDMAHQATCTRCERLDPSLYRCCDCQDIRLFCGRCLVGTHESLPFHRIKVSVIRH